MDKDRIFQEIDAFVKKGIQLDGIKKEAKSHLFWDFLIKTGTGLWLDNGDIEAASSNWFSGFLLSNACLAEWILSADNW